MRVLKKFFLILIFTAVVALAAGRLWLLPKYVVPIMMYHNVDYVETPEPNTVSPERFDWQMKYLKDRKYNVISLNELVNAIREERSLPRNSVVITFDDGPENNYTYAFKILKKYNFPAIIFMPSRFVDTAKFLKSAQIKEMLSKGISIGSHTQTHDYLPDLSREKQVEEIVKSKAELENKFDISVRYFAYPVGGFSEEIKDIVKQAGYKAAVATNRGYDRFNKDVYELNRVRFSDKDDRIDYMFIKLSGYYNLFRKSKSPY